MALPLFAIITADSEGVLGVLTIGTNYWNEISNISHHTPQKIFQDRFCHINAIPTRKSKTGSLVTRAQIFVISLETNNQNIINMLHNTRDIHN
jgi:hypothetical protein